MLLRSTAGSELLRSQGRCSSGAGARGGSCQERPSPTTRKPSLGIRGLVWDGEYRKYRAQGDAARQTGEMRGDVNHYRKIEADFRALG